MFFDSGVKLICMFVCLFVMFNTAHNSCSPRWVVYPTTRSDGALYNRAAGTLRRCLEACEHNTSCLIAEWDTNRGGQCWLHDRSITYRIYSDTVTQFKMVKRCNTTSGTCIYSNTRIFLEIRDDIILLIFSKFFIIKSRTLFVSGNKIHKIKIKTYKSQNTTVKSTTHNTLY